MSVVYLYFKQREGVIGMTDLIENLKTKGAAYRKYSGLTWEQTIKALRAVVKIATDMGLTREQAIRALKTGYGEV